MAVLNEMSRNQLESVAKAFDIEVDGRWNDQTLIGKLIEAGVTTEQIEGASNVLTDITGDGSGDALNMFSENGTSSDNKTVILRMDRTNASYSILGYKFTREHPYVPMPEHDALWIIDIDKGGFSLAHPTEAAEFYKKR